MPNTHLIVCLICSSFGSAVFSARAADPPAAPAPSSGTAAQVVMPPVPKPQVSYFRELLALSPAQLEGALAGVAEPAREKLRAKLQEYAALPSEARESRLRATELRWYLAPLMQTPPTNRVAQLTVVPEDLRLLVEERLKLWDALTPDIQTELRTNELMIRHLGRPPLPASQFENDLSPALRQKLNQQLGAWLLLPLAKRQRMCDRFERFFDLPSREKEKTLGALSDAERREMENTLKAFERLPSAQRHVCVNSFRKFANMTSEERAQFLKNAERWKEMSVEDRRAWRALVTKLPPLPPGFGQPPIPPLPLRPTALTNAGP